MQHQPSTIATSVLNARDILKEIGSGYDANLHAASISARMGCAEMIPNIFYIAIAYDGREFWNATEPDVDYEKVLDEARDNADKYGYEFTVYEVNISEQTIKDV